MLTIQNNLFVQYSIFVCERVIKCAYYIIIINTNKIKFKSIDMHVSHKNYWIDSY